MEYSCKLQNLI